jgi:hypothetical protein
MTRRPQGAELLEGFGVELRHGGKTLMASVASQRLNDKKESNRHIRRVLASSSRAHDQLRVTESIMAITTCIRSPLRVSL